MRLALGVAYDGSGFCGWQSQPSACGVQDALELALAKIALQPIRLHAAGRTDTGVHGLGPFAYHNLTLPAQREDETTGRAGPSAKAS